MSDTATQAQPGDLFDIPGVPGQSQFFDQYEDTQGVSVTVNSGSQQPVTGIADFRRTDVVTAWQLIFRFTSQTFTAGAQQTFTNSAYAPYNMVGPINLQIQNQYSSVKVESGIDLYILNLIRPYQQNPGYFNVINGANPAGSPLANGGQGYLNASTPQTSLVAPNAWSRSISGNAFDLLLDLPAGVWLQEYYALSIDGNYLGAVPDVFVSPQYMAGTQRLIKPSITMNQLIGSTDTAPTFSTTSANSGATASTASITAALTIRRKGVYGSSNTRVLPPVQPWQYSFTTQRFTFSGLTVTSNLKLPDNSGQVLSTYLRMFDPSAANGGAPIQLSAISTNVNSVQLLYGSGLTWFSGVAEEWQMRWLQRRGFLLPQGVLCEDFATDDQGTISNKRALNTYTTAGIQWVLNMTSTTSSTAYITMGVESLVYVTG